MPLLAFHWSLGNTCGNVSTFFIFVFNFCVFLLVSRPSFFALYHCCFRHSKSLSLLGQGCLFFLESGGTFPLSFSLPPFRTNSSSLSLSTVSRPSSVSIMDRIHVPHLLMVSWCLIHLGEVRLTEPSEHMARAQRSALGSLSASSGLSQFLVFPSSRTRLVDDPRRQGDQTGVTILGDRETTLVDHPRRQGWGRNVSISLSISTSFFSRPLSRHGLFTLS